MDRADVYEWLKDGPRWGRLATVGRDGYPHNVPLSFWLNGEDLVVNLRGQRLANVRRNPKVSFVIDSGSSMADLKGVVLQGDARIVDDPAECLELARGAARRRGVPEAELPTEVAPDRIFMRLNPSKIASWDYAANRR